MASYSVFISSMFGVRLADASNFTSLAYTRVVNDIGKLVLTLPSSFNTRYLIIPDGRIEVWRRIAGGREYLDTDTTWLIKALTQKRDGNGNIQTIVGAVTPLHLLREPGRIVNYAAGSSQADKASAPADNQIKAFIRDNIGTLATSSARNLASYLSVQADLGLAPSVPKAAAWRALLKVCQELAQASTEQGTYLAFDIVAPTPDSLEFRTYTGQRGVDHRFPSGQNPVILSPDFGNLAETELTIDYTDEVTYALAGGQGEQSNRLTASYQDTSRSGASPFGLRETFVQATQYKDDSTGGLTNEARAAVRAGRPRTTFHGRLLDTQDTAYGVHWAWGDYLTAQDFGRSFDCRVEAVSVSVEKGNEKVDAWIRSDAT